MCKHMMRVLDLNHVHDIPLRYILNRWRKDILRKHILVKVAYHDPAETEEVKRHKKLMSVFEPICDVAAMVDDDTVDVVVKGLHDLETKVLKRRQLKLDQTFGMNYPGEANPTVQIVSDGGGTSGSVQQNTEQIESDDVVNTTPQARIDDPVTKKRGQGRPKGSHNKTLQEIRYKIPAKKKGKSKGTADYVSDFPMESMVDLNNKLPVTRSKPSRKKKTVAAAASTWVGLDHIPEDDILLNRTWDSQSIFSQSF